MKSLTMQLKIHQVDMSPKKAFIKLKEASIVAVNYRINSKGKNVDFKVLTKRGLYFGMNCTNEHNVQTAIKFKNDTFDRLLKEVILK